MCRVPPLTGVPPPPDGPPLPPPPPPHALAATATTSASAPRRSLGPMKRRCTAIPPSPTSLDAGRAALGAPRRPLAGATRHRRQGARAPGRRAVGVRSLAAGPETSLNR